MGRCYLHYSSAMTHKHYILLDHKISKLTEVPNTSICVGLTILSCSSRQKQRPIELVYRARESKTIQIGIFHTVFPIIICISLSAYALPRHKPLLVLEVVDDVEDGAPSAIVSGGVPPNSRHHASGTYWIHMVLSAYNIKQKNPIR